MQCLETSPPFGKILIAEMCSGQLTQGSILVIWQVPESVLSMLKEDVQDLRQECCLFVAVYSQTCCVFVVF